MAVSNWLFNGRFVDFIAGEVSGENAGTGVRGDRGEAADLATRTENNDGATLAANTAVDARGGSPQGTHLSGAATPRPPRSRRRQNQNGLDTTQVYSHFHQNSFSNKMSIFLFFNCIQTYVNLRNLQQVVYLILNVIILKHSVRRTETAMFIYRIQV